MIVFHYAITAEYWPDTGFRDSADVFAIRHIRPADYFADTPLFRQLRHIFAIG
jgi:hypothetical protein